VRERGAHVRKLGLDAIEPLALVRAVHLGLCRTHEGGHEREVTVTQRPFLVAEVTQTFGDVLPHRLEHAEARLAVAAAHHEALVDERRESLELGAAHLLDGVERGAAAEHREPHEQRLLVQIEKPVAPVDRRAHRPLALGRVACAAREHVQARPEPFEEPPRR
jgi:hypothetical protein